MMYTQEAALKKLWSCKGVFLVDAYGDFVRDEHGNAKPNPHFGEDVFLYATLAAHVEMGRSGKKRVEAAGTAVLVTMVSRFGDVGIRAHDLTPPSHGYTARVIPDLLTDWRDEP